jgi:hypothetical protein
MAFGGLWKGFMWPDGTVTRTFAVITTDTKQDDGRATRHDAGDP